MNFRALLFLVVSLKAAPIGYLYLPYDQVELLSIDNFSKFVSNSSSNGWLIEFYANWCGYCQRFAPIWKDFASLAVRWRRFLRVGVVDCSDSTNTPLCRKHGISKYPTVQYFYRNDTGKIIPHGDAPYDLQLVKRNIYENLIQEKANGNGSMYPDLKPYNKPKLDEIFGNITSEVEYIILLINDEKATPFLGLEIILDFHQTNPKILTKYATNENEQLIDFLGLKVLPSLVITDRQNQIQIWNGISTNKTVIQQTIESFLANKNIILKNVVPSKLQNSTFTQVQEPAKELLRHYIKKMGDVIFQADLESSLRYSLQQEVAAVPVIKNEALRNLHAYLLIIKRYFPFGYNSTNLIDSLIMVTNQTEVTGSEIQKLVEENSGVFSTKQDFLGCRGSGPKFRGYPCSLWRLFHYLTVNSVLENIGRKNISPLHILEPISGYVKYFFSCAHCAEHFQKMVAERNMKDVDSLDGAILWLWGAHNAVNERIKGDETEDPEYIKEQWPVRTRCKHCYNDDGSFDQNEALAYLKSVYGRFNINYLGADTKKLFPGLK